VLCGTERIEVFGADAASESVIERLRKWSVHEQCGRERGFTDEELLRFLTVVVFLWKKKGA